MSRVSARVFVFCLATVAAGLLAVTLTSSASAGPCQPVSVGVDTSFANQKAVVWIGHSWNQVFTVSDTLINSIAVWRPARNDSMYFPIKLYVLDVDSSFGLQRPNTKQIVLDGPRIVVPGDGDGRPIRVEWAFSPPLALPHRGQFAFQVKEDLCGGSFALLSTSNDVYPGGDAWQTDPNVGCVGAGCCPGSAYYARDLVFEVEFCSDAVPTLPATWGRVKAAYR